MTELKQCRDCGQDLPRDQFPSDPRNRDGLGSHCTSCRARRKRERYAAGHAPRAPYQRDWYAQRRSAWLEANGPCAKCGSWENLEVDHIDPAQKAAEISRLWSLSEARRLPELAKCQVLCKPCHYEKSLAEGSVKPARHGSRNRYDHGGCRCDLCRARNAVRARAKRANKKARQQQQPPLDESALYAQSTLPAGTGLGPVIRGTPTRR